MNRRIVIVGGGTAGWLTAAWLIRTLGPAGWAVTVVESADIGIIGVGEGTFPTIRDTLAAIGADERRFLKEADASFKQGVRFVDWAGGPTPGSPADDYFHPFNLPYGGDEPGLLPYWIKAEGEARRPSYADAVTAQGHVIRAGRAPKRAEDPAFAGPMNYAYHFDAARFAAYLRDTAIGHGVERIEATIGEVRRAPDGTIAAVVPTDGRAAVAGDFFVDCSGFRALLIGDTLASPFASCGGVLFNDRALAIQVPHAAADTPIRPYTLATAHEAGWTWDIGLGARRGIGYVYSSRHSDDEAAERVLRAYVGKGADGLSVRQLRFATGYRERQWVGNCAAIGLAAGFFEPLESTGIMLIEIAARMLGDFLAAPALDAGAMAAASRQFNQLMAARFAAIVEFLKLHYCISGRRDTAYWRDNTDPATWPEGLRDKLAQWRHRPPSRFDFVVDHETFLSASWRFILYGMGFRTDPAATLAVTPADADAGAAFIRVRQAADQAVAALPSHRALLDQLRLAA
ncbi:tryptophan halogenase family protein [Sphingomonas quercus]|uniref:Tryptophan 7-halogenase n=1 Tax=Sphingomonas quercus TaxID=2842451 RepID=A0ABS6BKF3_9SPHN|nr:tryptophan halogenase family protein [Sphingomonas quercus]MBU3077739.1 tryptophan 7-halogenase [Sphingomonas quercus]